MLHACIDWILSCHECGASVKCTKRFCYHRNATFVHDELQNRCLRGRADWCNIISIKDDPGECQSINVGSEDLRRTVKAHIVES